MCVAVCMYVGMYSGDKTKKKVSCNQATAAAGMRFRQAEAKENKPKGYMYRVRKSREE